MKTLKIISIGFLLIITSCKTKKTGYFVDIHIKGIGHSKTGPYRYQSTFGYLTDSLLSFVHNGDTIRLKIKKVKP